MRVYEFNNESPLDDGPHTVEHEGVQCVQWDTIFADQSPDVIDLVDAIYLFVEEKYDGRIWMLIRKGDTRLHKLMPTTDVEEAKRTASFIYDIL